MFGSYNSLQVWGSGRLVDSFNYRQNAPCSGTSSGAQMAVVFCLDGLDVWLHIPKLPLYHWVSDHNPWGPGLTLTGEQSRSLVQSISGCPGIR